MNFKAQHSPQARLNESSRVKAKYPDRIPIICEKLRGVRNSTMPDIDKSKFLVPTDLTMGQFQYVIRKRIKLSAEKAIFLLVNGNIPPSSESMSKIYENHKDEDGFLYITYSGENVFG